jgi:hypothetical protein
MDLLKFEPLQRNLRRHAIGALRAGKQNQQKGEGPTEPPRPAPLINHWRG